MRGSRWRSWRGVESAVCGGCDDYKVVVRRHFKRLTSAAGLPSIRPYDLRHTSATLDLLVGTPIKVVSERLGHSDVKMTLQTYQHVLPDMQLEAARAMDALLHEPQHASSRAAISD